jgi:hypothetical protein
MGSTPTLATNDVLVRAMDFHLTALAGVEWESKPLQFPVKLLGECVEPGAEGFYGQIDGSGKYLVDRMIKGHLPVEMTFRIDQSAAFFNTFAVRKKKRYWLNRTVIFRMPTRVKVVQQREETREPIPEDYPLTAKVLPGIQGAELVAKIGDLSKGGMSVVLPADKVEKLMAEETPVRVEFDFHGQSICVDAELRNARPLSAQDVRVGLQFTAEGQSSPTGDPEYLRRLADLENLRITRHLREQLKRR